MADYVIADPKRPPPARLGVIAGFAVLNTGLVLMTHALAMSAAALPYWAVAALLLLGNAALGVLVWQLGRRVAAAMPAPLAEDRRAAEIMALRQTRHDPLTGLTTRRLFDERLGALLAKRAQCAVLLLDIDGFHKVNEKLGMQAGDFVLQQVADRLRHAGVAEADLAHLFSDDFAILHDNTGNDAEVRALHLMEIFDTAFSADGSPLTLSASIGIALAPQHGATPEELMAAADQALHQARSRGGRCWQFHSSKLRISARQLRGDLRDALRGGQVIPYYQPVMDLAAGEVSGLELLARWAHPSEGVLLPEHFMTLAEDEGLLDEITSQLLNCAARDSRHWPDGLTFTINVAVSQMPGLPRLLAAYGTTHGLKLSDLILDLIKGHDLAMMDDVADLVRELTAQGVRLCLDDFGVGGANFQQLHGIAFNRIKIDREFVVDLLSDSRAEYCIRAVVDVGRKLGAEVAAKGVAHAGVAERLQAMGCRYAQGSLYGMPVPAQDVPQALLRANAQAAHAQRASSLGASSLGASSLGAISQGAISQPAGAAWPPAAAS